MRGRKGEGDREEGIGRDREENGDLKERGGGRRRKRGDSILSNPGCYNNCSVEVNSVTRQCRKIQLM